MFLLSFGGGNFQPFSPLLELFYKSPQFFFPHKERGSLNLLVPGLGDHLLETFLMYPQGTETKGNGAKISIQQELKQNGLMIRGVVQQYFRGGH